MCGIAGGIRHTLSGPEEAAQVLGRLQHRGPDDSGIWTGEGIWLANTRLAIQDLSAGGTQPMHTADGRYIIVYNGELYNAPALREKLKNEGIICHTRCDTEVLLHAYAAWGPDCLQRLEGDFAFAVWNTVRKELFIARDPMGVKPLYIYNDGKQLLFASEIKALLQLHGLDYTLQPEVFSEYLRYLYTPSAQTPFRFIKKLLPGHCLRMSAEDSSGIPKRYHSLSFNPEKHTSTHWAATLDETLTSVIGRQLHSDAPVGLMLSGGLDSSLIAALARKNAPQMPLQAFTINTGAALAGEGFEDDIGYARQVAQQLRIPLQEVDGRIHPSGKLIDELVWSLDEPQADPAAWYTGQIAAAARSVGVKVLLSGTGGDDVFSGYRRHQAISFFQMMAWMPGWAGKVTSILQSAAPGSASMRRLSKLMATSGLSARHAAIHSHFWTAPALSDSLFAQDLLPATQSPYALFDGLLQEIPQEHSLLQQMLLWEQRAFLPHHNLAYMDKMAMAHSVEIRVPFVDREVVSLASGMPPELKMQGRTTKAILRTVAKPYLPAAIIQRRKTGFGAPLRSWMRSELSGLLRERLMDDSFYRRGIFNRKGVERLISANASGKTDGAYTLFSLLCIESWLRQFARNA